MFFFSPVMCRVVLGSVVLCVVCCERGIMDSAIWCTKSWSIKGKGKDNAVCRCRMECMMEDGVVYSILWSDVI